MINYYKILGVKNFADFSEIRRAYLKLVKQHHPDLHPDKPDSTAIFQYLTEAHEVLSDPEKRRHYDNRLKSALYGFQEEVREDPRKKRREMIIRMREKALAKELFQFEQLNARFPLKWRIVLSILILIWGIQMIYSNWFPYMLDESKAHALIGFFILIAGVCWISNLYYRKNRIAFIKNRNKTPYTRNSMLLFAALLLGGFGSIGGLSKIRETYHLRHYAEIIPARLNYITVFGEANLHYEWENVTYYAEIQTTQEDLIRPEDGFILIRISRREPRIIRLIKKTDP